MSLNLTAIFFCALHHQHDGDLCMICTYIASRPPLWFCRTCQNSYALSLAVPHIVAFERFTNEGMVLGVLLDPVTLLLESYTTVNQNDDHIFLFQESQC